MISFNLRCAEDHVFEAWFKDSATYDRQGRVVDQLEGGTDRWAFDYDLDDGEQVTTVTGPSGAQHRYQYRDRVLRTITDPLGHRTTFRYDRDLNLAAVTDPLGHVTRFTHDRSGRVREVIHHAAAGWPVPRNPHP
jgi:YD repeat-containing protein